MYPLKLRSFCITYTPQLKTAIKETQVINLLRHDKHLSRCDRSDDALGSVLCSAGHCISEGVCI